LAAALGLSALLAPSSAFANNDPHRTFLAATPFDLVGFCNFPVHFDFPINKEYGTITMAADGSTIIKFTGSLFPSVTNEATGKTITLNASGPGTITISPDGTTEQFNAQGVGIIFAPNLTQFGFPSELVQTSGLAVFTEDLGTGSIVSFTTVPHLLLDVCAALA
jgi:hypothetical protein